MAAEPGFPQPSDAFPHAAETLSAPRPHLRLEGLTRYKQAIDSAVRIPSRLSIVICDHSRVVHEFLAPAPSYRVSRPRAFRQEHTSAGPESFCL